MTRIILFLSATLQIPLRVVVALACVAPFTGPTSAQSDLHHDTDTIQMEVLDIGTVNANPDDALELLLGKRQSELDVSDARILIATQIEAPASLATAWAIGITGVLLPVGLIVASPDNGGDFYGWALLGTYVLGASGGNFYLGDTKRGLIGVAIRGGGLGASLLVGAAIGDWDGLGVAVLGWGLTYLIGTVYNLSTLDDSARDRGYVLTPGVTHDGAPNLTLTMNF